MADGQVTQGSEILKPNVTKVRTLEGGGILLGFAGSTADALTLCERLESRLEAYPGQLTRAAIELATDWRTDKYLRRLDAVLVVADTERTLHLSGNGDVLESHDGVMAIGSGAAYAGAAARALMDTEMSADAIASKAMNIAANSCIYTNHEFAKISITAASSSSSELAKATNPESESHSP